MAYAAQRERRRTWLHTLAVAGILAFASAHTSRVPLEPSRAIQRIAFGSCNKQYKTQPVWNTILNRRPDVWVWLGDAIYADSPVVLTIRRPGTLDDVARGYADQLANTNYSRFIAQVPVIGVWDDHDVGVDNAHRTNPGPDFFVASSKLALDFYGEPLASPRRGRPGGGLWASYLLGDRPSRLVHVILLDVRSGMDANAGPSSEAQDVLGPAQWAWLEAELADPARRGAVTLIASGIQITPRNDRLIETWAMLHPQSLARLLALLARYSRPRVVLLSGDVHVSQGCAACSAGLDSSELHEEGLRHAAASALQLTSETCNGILGYPILEFTSSGLTHSFGGGAGAITAMAMALGLNPRTRVGHALMHMPSGSARVPDAAAAAWDSGAFFGGESFGEIEVEWPEDAPPSNSSAGGGATLNTPSLGGQITLRAVDVAGTVRFEHTVPFDFLAPWPASFHASNGLLKASPADLSDCADAGLGGGLTPQCTAVLASCDGHRGIDLGDTAQRRHSAAVIAFKAAMTVAAVLALGGAPAALAWLVFVVGAGSPTASVGNSGRQKIRSALVVAVVFLLYAALWWEHAVIPFEA